MALKSKFEKMAEENGLVLSENADKIIKVKERLIKLSPFFLTRRGVTGRGSPPAAG